MALDFHYTPRARKELLDVPRADRERIAGRVEAYVADPKPPQHDVRTLVNRVPTYRMRVGDWRVLFEIEDDTMRIDRILHRREAYR